VRPIPALKIMMALCDIIAVEKSLLVADWDEIVSLVPLDRLGAWVPNHQADLAYWLAKPIAVGFVDPADPRAGRQTLLAASGALAVATGAQEPTGILLAASRSIGE